MTRDQTEVGNFILKTRGRGSCHFEEAQLSHPLLNSVIISVSLRNFFPACADGISCRRDELRDPLATHNTDQGVRILNEIDVQLTTIAILMPQREYILFCSNKLNKSAAAKQVQSMYKRVTAYVENGEL